ncbi:MAG: chloramphenicol acetyltransferase, partial [Muribaculaceae bacterium]|nr:chloramphenicol acetyltransferase [Muribaculaceae bacterium]
LDVTRLLTVAKRDRLKFNMLMCWCIGKAAVQVKEFFILPVGDKLYKYDSIAVNTIVLNKNNEVSSCDIPFDEDLRAFNAEYLRLTEQVKNSCENHDETERMVIGTSALVQYDIDGAVGMYSGVFNNPFMIWAKYKKEIIDGEPKTTLKVSFQFHHTQMDGAHAATFLNLLQSTIDNIS